MDTLTNDLSKPFWEADRKHHLHPWEHFESFGNDGALVISKGEGCCVWDARGNKYLDAVGGLWCTNIGQGRREMAEAIAAQVERLPYSSCFVDMTTEPAALLSEKLAELAPGDLSWTHFTTGGSTALDSAIRMVHHYQSSRGKPEKRHIISRSDSYHGATYACMCVGKRKGDQIPEFAYDMPGVHHLSAPNQYRMPEGQTPETFTDWLEEEIEELVARVGAERIAAFFAEPIQASGGVIVPPDGYLRRMKAACERHDMLFVADEVVTGFGRLGHWFASESEFGIQPDIICCAKGLSSGYLPIGALIYSDRIHKAMAASQSGVYAGGFTYSGHPVSCAAALKNIEIIEREGLLDRAKEAGSRFEERLGELRELPIVGDVRGRKLMMCVESVADKATKKQLPEEINIGKRISDAAEEKGLIVRPLGHLNVMSPALVINESQIDFVAGTLGEAIRKVTDQLVREGVRIG